MKNRCKIFYVPANVILTLLGNWKHHDNISLPVLKGLPEGYEILATHYEIDRGSIGLLVYHESFPEVHPGCRYPVGFDGHAEVEVVTIPAFIDPDKAVAEYHEAIALAAKSGNWEPVEAKTKVGWEFLGAP